MQFISNDISIFCDMHYISIQLALLIIILKMSDKNIEVPDRKKSNI